MTSRGPAQLQRAATLAGCLLLWSAGCAPSPVPATAPEPPPLVLEARLPTDRGPLGPSQALFGGLAPSEVEQLAEGCVRCHDDIARQWEDSAHAHASLDNPWYRAGLLEVHQTAGAEATRHCGGCHDPMLLARDGVVDPAPEQPLADAGVGCLLCHAVEQTSPDGNGSWTARWIEHSTPAIDDPASLAAHRAELAIGSAEQAGLCLSCHRGILEPRAGTAAVLPGVGEPGSHAHSAWGGSDHLRIDDVEPASCVDCHMAPVATGAYESMTTPTIASHRFPGGHTALAAHQSEAQLAAVQAQLQRTFSLSFGAVDSGAGPAWPALGPVRYTPGMPLTFSLTLFNEGAGHHAPGGTRDAQDTWLEITLRDAAGRIRAAGGDGWREGQPDDALHRLVVGVADAEGNLLLAHETPHFATPVYDHTVAPRDARAADYAWTPPEDIEGPLTIEARLLHRRHHPVLAERACAVAHPDDAADACAPQPITELTRATLVLHPGDRGAEPTPEVHEGAFLALYRAGLAALHDRSEHLDRARIPLHLALDIAQEQEDARRQAMVLSALARLAGRQGRLEEALELSAQGEQLWPHPTHDYARAAAYARVWKWEEAAHWWGRVAEHDPRDTRVWVELATARGSAGDAEGALRAAQRGLQLHPRQPDLLRSQWLALQDLGAETAQVDAARAAWLAWRGPDDANQIAMRCSQRDPACAQDRLPRHTHPLRTVAP